MSDLKPPPKGPGLGAQLELLYECRICGEKHLRAPAGEPVVGPPLRPVEDVGHGPCGCPCHDRVHEGLDLCPRCGPASDWL